MSTGTLISVNVGKPAVIRTPKRAITTAIWKKPVAGRVRVREAALDGDAQADLSVHGGPDKAVYAYASEDATWWEGSIARTIEPGGFGENLTTAGIDASGALVGERWQIGSALLEVVQPRLPCFKLGLRMDDERFPARFAAADRPGAYLRVIERGELGAGDPIKVLSRPRHKVTMALMSRAILRDRDLLPQLLAAPELSDEWRELVADRRRD